MQVIKLQVINRTYKNNGQHAEQVARFTLTGEIQKADNKPFYMGGDCLDIQIKSAKATVCKGADLIKYLDMDGANRYGYVTLDFNKMFLMNREEYIEFVNNFGYVTIGSSKENHCEKIRLKSESKKLIEWLEERAR